MLLTLYTTWANVLPAVCFSGYGSILFGYLMFSLVFNVRCLMFSVYVFSIMYIFFIFYCILFFYISLQCFFYVHILLYLIFYISLQPCLA